MGSKSVGEPPLLLSASVMSAFQMAVAAAKEDLAHQHRAALAAAASAGAEPQKVRPLLPSMLYCDCWLGNSGQLNLGSFTAS